MPLTIYNTLTRQKEEFSPIHKDHVGMYVCGPTVYGHSHVGHAKSYVSFDTIVRYLRHRGHNVTYIQNITDVGHLLGDANDGEDRLLRQGKLEHKHPMEIAELYTRSYFEDMDRLNILRPDISPRATGHIVEQIELIRELIDKGFAYEVNGSVYFDVAKDKEYGKLSGRNVEEAESGTRVEVKSEKRHPSDFALWKRAAAEHIMQWPSPWGIGFPGWHVECSAMSMKYLGSSFDIHGGGLDNQFPHHECEIAQSECATGVPFVKYWIHNNLVTVNGQKMSKSLGNTFLLKDLFVKYDPLVIRFFIQQSHYRGTLDFSEDALNGARVGLERLTNSMRVLSDTIRVSRTLKTDAKVNAGEEIRKFEAAFTSAMDDGFNTPKAIGSLFDLVGAMNEWFSAQKFPDTESLNSTELMIKKLAGGVLGILPQESGAQAGPEKPTLAELADLFIEIRNQARADKQWPLSDKIRDGLEKLGIKLEDAKGETIWRRIR
jgi:cysteinyl-tRNA synthetase